MGGYYVPRLSFKPFHSHFTEGSHNMLNVTALSHLWNILFSDNYQPNLQPFLYKNIVFPAQAKYSYFSADLRLTIFLQKFLDNSLLHGCVSQGLGTTKFTNLIGWNGYWPRSRFSHLDRHQTGNVLQRKTCKLKCKIIDCFHLTVLISVSAQKADDTKK